MPDVRAMCAIGQRGQLGLGGRMPWEGERGPAYVADVQRFWEATRGHVLLVGPVTRAPIPAFAYGERTIWGATAGMVRALYDRLYGEGAG